MSDTKLSETLRKLVSAGLSGAALSEELLRHYLSETKLPKELVQPLVSAFQKSKEEMFQKIGSEVLKQIDKVDWAKHLESFLENHRVQVRMELEFKKKRS